MNMTMKVSIRNVMEIMKMTIDEYELHDYEEHTDSNIKEENEMYDGDCEEQNSIIR